MKNNYSTINLELIRIEVCDLLLACLAAKELSNDGGKKWMRLHQKLKDQLEKFDMEADMKTVSDIKEVLTRYESKMNDLLEAYKIDKGADLEANKKFNALIYHLEDAYISLEKGLNGEF